MTARAPWITGTSFAFTVAFVYIACAVAVLLYPDGVLRLANTWAHGLDLTMIRRAADNPMALVEWGSGFVTSVVFAFVVGVVYRWSDNWFAGLAPVRVSSGRSPGAARRADILG